MQSVRTLFAVVTAFTGLAWQVTPIQAQTLNLGSLGASNQHTNIAITAPAGGPHGGYELTLDWRNLSNAQSSEARWQLLSGNIEVASGDASPTSANNNQPVRLSWWGGFDTPITAGTPLTFRYWQQFFATDSIATWNNVQLRFVPTPAAASLMLLATGMLAPRRRA